MESVLEMRGICKAFPGVQALQDVDLEVRPGEVLALLGENGAGKSTLIKILGGAHVPDAGSVRFLGREVELKTPADALRAGIAVIYQEFNLIPGLNARENLFLGREESRLGFLQGRAEQRRAEQLFRQIGVAVDPRVPCRYLSVAQQQAVEIAKALSMEARLLVLDEPSATLTPREVEALFGIIRDLKKRGLGIIYISHRLEEIFEIADRVMVLRDGKHVGTKAVRDVTRPELIRMMVGRELAAEFPPRRVEKGAARLVVEEFRREPRVRGVSFAIRGGEVLGLTGLVGAGRTETARLIFGADRRDDGTVSLDGKKLDIRAPADAIRAGICLLTEDRKEQGLVLGLSVLENFGLPNLSRFSRAGFVRGRCEREAFRAFAEQMRLRITGPGQRVATLSGGNQQKVVLAKWLQANTEVVLFDEPTRGIDVGAKFEIYQLINQLAAQGKAILLISSELPEVLGMADRILVMHEGRITGEIADVPAATQEQIMELAVR